MADEMFLPRDAHHFLLMDATTGSLLRLVPSQDQVVKALEEARQEEEEDLSSVLVVAVDDDGRDRRSWLAQEFLGEAGYPVLS